jgi:hypothetical protein
MAEIFPVTTSELKRLRYLLRCYLCETLYIWSIKVAPDGYIPAHIDTAAMEEWKQKDSATSPPS